jgi:colicin import membrane protein
MIAPQRMQHVSSGGLALLVHGMLLLALMVGVSWKNPPHLPVEADIWTELPAPAPPITPPVLETPPEAQPKLAEKPAPVPDQAQIALEKAEKKREEQRQAELQRQADKTLAEKKLAEEKRVEALRQAEQDRVEKQRVEKERADKEKVEKEKRDQSRRQIDQEMARQAREELDAEGAQLRAMQTRDKLSRQTRVVRDFQDRIRAKIKDALVMPQNLKGDAEVIFQVSLLPNGEVARVTLVKTSGQPLYDGAVERAIYKASPLPLPNERDAAAPFRDGLTLKFRPSEDAVGLR